MEGAVPLTTPDGVPDTENTTSDDQNALYAWLFDELGANRLVDPDDVTPAAPPDFDDLLETQYGNDTNPMEWLEALAKRFKPAQEELGTKAPDKPVQFRRPIDPEAPLTSTHLRHWHNATGYPFLLNSVVALMCSALGGGYADTLKLSMRADDTLIVHVNGVAPAFAPTYQDANIDLRNPFKQARLRELAERQVHQGLADAFIEATYHNVTDTRPAFGPTTFVRYPPMTRSASSYSLADIARHYAPSAQLELRYDGRLLRAKVLEDVRGAEVRVMRALYADEAEDMTLILPPERLFVPHRDNLFEAAYRAALALPGTTVHVQDARYKHYVASTYRFGRRDAVRKLLEHSLNGPALFPPVVLQRAREFTLDGQRVVFAFAMAFAYPLHPTRSAPASLYYNGVHQTADGYKWAVMWALNCLLRAAERAPIYQRAHDGYHGSERQLPEPHVVVLIAGPPHPQPEPQVTSVFLKLTETLAHDALVTRVLEDGLLTGRLQRYAAAVG